MRVHIITYYIVEESDADQAQEWLEESSLAYLGLKTILFPFQTGEKYLGD